MNAGRLHAVLEEIKRDYETNAIVTKLESTVSALSSSIASSSEESANAFKAALTDLYAALDRSPSGEATSSELEIFEEIGASNKLGLGLRGQIQGTLDANNVTPADALAQLKRISDEVTNFSKTVSQTVEGLEELKIPYDELDPGETEIGVLVPWVVVDSNLKGLQEEIHEFDKALRIFGELVEDRSQSPEIRSIGSSKLQMFVNSTPAIALCVATAIERLCALYKKILEIKLLRKQLREKSVPEEVVTSLQQHEDQMAEKEIERITDDLIREFSKKKGEKEGRTSCATDCESRLDFSQGRLMLALIWKFGQSRQMPRQSLKVKVKM